MGNRKVSFAPGEYYHIYNRGVDKRIIFMEPKDHFRFICLLYLCNTTKNITIRDLFMNGFAVSDVFKFNRGDTIVDVGAYCLMSNHFHLLIKEKIDGGISLFMKKILTAYSMYFNKKNKRVGSLFEGAFKSSHVDNDEYLKYLFAYIHLNPVKIMDIDWKNKLKNSSNQSQIRKYLDEYSWSSYPDYTDKHRTEGKIINKEVFPDYFNNKNEFDDFVNFWINYSKDPIGVTYGID